MATFFNTYSLASVPTSFLSMPILFASALQQLLLVTYIIASALASVLNALHACTQGAI